MNRSPFRPRAVATIFLAACLAALPFANAQSPTPPPKASAAPAQQPAAGGKTFSQQDLDELLAPIALYPDALLAQVLMASTYPLDVVEADRWVKANAKLKGKELEDAAQKQDWDPAVKALAVLPQVLTMMSEKIDWTTKLGNAFLAQQADVMKTAQSLRKKAQEAGNLKSTPEQTVKSEKQEDRKSTRLNSSHIQKSRMPSSA